MKKFILGVDVGGTNLKFGLSDPSGTILARRQLSTKDFLVDPRKPGGLIASPAKLIAAVSQGVRTLLEAYPEGRKAMAGVGLGLPGPVDSQKGVVKFLPNIPGWKNVPLQNILEKELSLPVVIENDVNMITLGEWRFGAGMGARDMVCITLGTGVGGGLILNGQMYRGAGFAAGEIGHMPLNEDGPDCPCGGLACLERYVGNAALQRRLADIFGDPQMRIEDAFALAVRGDAKALAFWEQTGTRIGTALASVVNVLNPSLIIIGGGVANNHRFLFPPIRSAIKRRAMKVQSAQVKVTRARLGNDAGFLGARVLLEERRGGRNKDVR